MNRGLLDDSRIGIAVNKLSKSSDERVASLATNIVGKWKQMLQDLKKKQSGDPPLSNEIPGDSKKRPLEDDDQSASSVPLKKQRIEPPAGTSSGANPVGTLSPTVSSTPGGNPFANGAGPDLMNHTVSATMGAPMLPPTVGPSPNHDAVMTDAPPASRPRTKSILASADRPKTGKRVSFAEPSKLVQEKGTPRWVTVLNHIVSSTIHLLIPPFQAALRSMSLKANLSEQDMAKIAFEEAAADFRSARQEMMELTRPAWEFPKRTDSAY